MPQPILLNVGLIQPQPGQYSDETSHPFHELICLLTPGYTSKIDKKSIAGAPGDLFFYPLNTRHQGISRHDLTVRFYLLQWRDTCEGYNDERVLHCRDSLGRIHFLLHWMWTLFPARNLERRKQLQHLLKVLLGELRRLCSEHDATDITRVQHYIELCLHRPVSLRELAQFAHCSPRHLIRRFKAETGTTPGRYQYSLRVERALSLLRSTRDPIEEIAAKVGLTGRSQLSRMLYDATGQTPRELREAIRKPTSLEKRKKHTRKQ